MLDLSGETPAMSRIFACEAKVRAMLAFEAALAEAQAELGLIPIGAAAAIARVCRVAPETLLRAVEEGARLAGNPAIPLVEALIAEVRATDPEAARYVHFGSTSQDVIDSATMLLAREAIDTLDADIVRLQRLLADLATAHAATPMLARTLLQQALPTTFGFKVTGWLLAVDRARSRLHEVRRSSLALQLGGPVGTLDRFPAVAETLMGDLARRLGLPCCAAAWHTTRAPVAEVGNELACLTAHMGKIGRDLVLLMQSEVGEVAEAAAPGKGGSSAMPHKRNPVSKFYAIAAATEAPHIAAALMSAMAHEHERAAGCWHAEWPLLPRLFGLAHRAVLSIADAIDGLEVDADRMRAAVDRHAALAASARLVDDLAPALGRDGAHRTVAVAVREASRIGTPLAEVLATMLSREAPGLDRARIAAILDTGADVSAIAERTRRLLAARLENTRRPRQV